MIVSVASLRISPQNKKRVMSMFMFRNIRTKLYSKPLNYEICYYRISRCISYLNDEVISSQIMNKLYIILLCYIICLSVRYTYYSISYIQYVHNIVHQITIYSTVSTVTGSIIQYHLLDTNATLFNTSSRLNIPI